MTSRSLLRDASTLPVVPATGAALARTPDRTGWDAVVAAFLDAEVDSPNTRRAYRVNSQ